MNTRRAAAFVVARWIATHGHVSDMLPEGADRAFVQDIVYTTVRRFRSLRSVLGKLVPKWPKGEMEALLLVGGAQILYMPDVPDFAAVNETVAAAKCCPNKSIAKVVNGVLRNLIRRREEFEEYLRAAPLAERESFPNGLVNRWLERYGEENAEKLCKWHNKPSVKYFELDDIVPIATKIFEEVGLISVVNFDKDVASLTIVNTEKGDECIEFTAPMIVSEGNKAVTPVQALGATITYYRRYLYMMALDICEPDEIDSIGTAPVTNPAPVATPAPTIPVTPKAEEPKPLTSGSGNASPTQVRQLKDLLLKLKEKDPTKEGMIEHIALQTQSFTALSKADCEALVIKIGEMLKEGE